MAAPRKFALLCVALTVLALVALPGTGRRLEARAGSTALYVALGDSIEFGLGDDIAQDGIGYVPPFGVFVASALGQPVDVRNLGVPVATTLDIMHTQLPQALAAIGQHPGDPIVVSWGGGGNDLGLVALSHQAAVCLQAPSCLARFNAVLNEAEQAIDRTIGRLRAAGGPDARIFMRTQYNALLKTGCGTPTQVAIANATLEGAPGTILDRGLNDRIRTIAARYGATVVDLFPTFAFLADQLVSTDCVHPNGLGYQAILNLYAAAF